MAQYEWSEVFMSIEGEGPYYVRFTGCNFTCMKFNNPENLNTTTNDGLGFNPEDYNNLKDVPLITRGCDSIYSWDKRFSHLWHKGDVDVLVKEIIDIAPFFVHPTTGQKLILSITGGEPTLQWKKIPQLLNHKELYNLKHVLIETNCSVPFKEEFIESLATWLYGRANRKFTWSNSPKLPSVSGESWEKAIQPKIASMQRQLGHKGDQYFKFVCDDSDEAFDEVETAMNEYINHDYALSLAPVYIMPMACTEQQQEGIAARVAQKCIERGYIYCHRIQNSVFGNGVGT